jgi:hypothetical protein
VSVAIDEGQIYVGAEREDPYGAVYLYRPDSTGAFGPFESDVFETTPESLSDGLGKQVKAEDGFLMAVAGAAGFSAGTKAVHAFSAGLEEDICDGSVNDGVKLDSWIDSKAGLSPNGLRRRGLVLSNAPQFTRFILLGGLSPDTTASGSLFGVAGLCLSPPMVRVGFGVVAGSDHLALVGANDLYLGGDRLLTVIGTVYVQAFCAPPATSGVPSGWTNGFVLDVAN